MPRYRFDDEHIAVIRARCPELHKHLDDQDAIDNPSNRLTLIERAREEYCLGSNDNIEVDDDAQLSPGPESNGCWVQGWLWLYNEENADA